MTDESALEGTSATERVVLFELAELSEGDRTPAQAPAILRGCRDRLDALDDVVAGRVTEADLVRSCRALEAEGLVTEREPDATSPAGKGRPAYDLAVDPDAVRAVVGDDDRFVGSLGGDATS